MEDGGQLRQAAGSLRRYGMVEASMAEATSDKHLKIGAKRVGLARNVNLKARWNVRKSRAAVILRAARRAVPRSAACLGPQARLPPSLGVPILRCPIASGRIDAT